MSSACSGATPTAPEPPEPTAVASSAITRGTPDTGDPALVGIVSPMKGLECTGVLVTPYVVLTAAHCSVPAIASGATVVVGSSVASSVASVPVVAAVPNPQFDPATFDGDVGLLVLGAAAPATPIAIGPAPKVGDTVEIVGWGLTGEDAGDLGTKREGTTTVTAVSSTSFDVAAHPSQPCAGDSGGPALVTSQGTVFVVGIVSHGDAACSAGATYARPDAFEASFITPTLARYAPGTAATGDRCLFQAQCAGGAASCVAATDDPSLTYCTKACSGSGDCPATMTCASAGGGMQCLYPVPTPGAYGAPCQSDSDCVEGECSSADSPTPSAGVCALRCEPQSASCPSGYACQQTGAIDFFCIATPSSASGGGGGSGGGCGLAPGTESRFGLLGACLLLVVGAVRRATYRRAASPRHAPITPAPRTSARSGVRLRARTHARSPGCEQ